MSATSLKAKNVPKIPVGTRKNWEFDSVDHADEPNHSNASSAQATSRVRNPGYGWKRDPRNATMATLFKPVFSGKASLEGRNVALDRKPENKGGPLESLVPFIYKHEVARKQKTEKDLSSLVLDQSQNQNQSQGVGLRSLACTDTTAPPGSASPEQKIAPVPVEGRPPVPRTPMSDEVLDAAIADIPMSPSAPIDTGSPRVGSTPVAIGTMFDVRHFPGIAPQHDQSHDQSRGSESSRGGRGPRVHQVGPSALHQFERSLLEVSPIKPGLHRTTGPGAAAAAGRLRSDSMASVASMESMSSLASGFSQNSMVLDDGQINSQISDIYSHYNQGLRQAEAEAIDAQLLSKGSALMQGKLEAQRHSRSIAVLNTINQVAGLADNHRSSDNHRSTRRQQPRNRTGNKRTQRQKQSMVVNHFPAPASTKSASASAEADSLSWVHRPLAPNDSAPWVADRRHTNTIADYTGENICQQLQMSHLPLLQQSDELLSPYSSDSVIRPGGGKASLSAVGSVDFDAMSVGSEHLYGGGYSVASSSGGSLAGSAASVTDSKNKNKARAATDWQDRKQILQYCPHDSSAVQKTINFQTKKVKPMFEKFSSDCRLSKLAPLGVQPLLQITGAGGIY